MSPSLPASPSHHKSRVCCQLREGGPLLDVPEVIQVTLERHHQMITVPPDAVPLLVLLLHPHPLLVLFISGFLGWVPVCRVQAIATPAPSFPALRKGTSPEAEISAEQPLCICQGPAAPRTACPPAHQVPWVLLQRQHRVQTQWCELCSKKGDFPEELRGLFILGASEEEEAGQ